jgi:ATP-binding cassette subfamily F protein 3
MAELVDTYIEDELEKIISEILKIHDDFNFYEIQEICQDFLDDIPTKIKSVTKIKRLRKFVTCEFELDKNQSWTFFYNNKQANWEYSLESIPKYLFEWKTKIQSGLINIINLKANIWLTDLFDWLNLKINKTDKVALIWKNGCWKTTLLRLIIWKNSDLLEKEWEIKIAPELNIWYLSQDLFWESESNTLEEEMFKIFPIITEKVERLDTLKSEDDYEEIQELTEFLLEDDWFKKYDLQKNILKYFGFSEEKMKQNVLSLSGWEQTKVQIAKFLIREVDLLILDEPTNHLDIEGIIFLERFCQNWKKAIVSISHDKRFIDNSSEKIVEIYQHRAFNYVWKYSDFEKQKQEKFEKEFKDFKDQKKIIDEEEAYINRFRANSAKASAIQSRIKALEKVVRLTEPENEQKARFISISTTRRLPEIIIKLRNIEVWYSEKLITLPEEINVLKTDKIWIIWANWTWKTTLLKTILWDLKALTWTSEINETLKIGSFAQILDELNLENSIINELSENLNGQQEVRKILWGLLIQWEKVNQKINSLSGWERAKVGLTKMLLQKPDIIIMDEPTNHLDLHSKEIIKTMLDWFDWMTLIVSHDRDLLENVSNKIWLIRNKGLEIFDDVERWIAEVY